MKFQLPDKTGVNLNAGPQVCEMRSGQDYTTLRWLWRKQLGQV